MAIIIIFIIRSFIFLEKNNNSSIDENWNVKEFIVVHVL